MGIGKFIIAAAVSAVAENAMEKSRNEKEIAHEKAVTEQKRVQAEKEIAKLQAKNERMALKNERKIAAMQAKADQRMLLEEQARERELQQQNDIRQARERGLQQLNDIRLARAENPILLSCPRCDGRREIDRMKGSMVCPYCDFVEMIHPAHKYHPEIDGAIMQNQQQQYFNAPQPQQYNQMPQQYFPPQQPQPYNQNVQQPANTIKGFFNKYFK